MTDFFKLAVGLARAEGKATLQQVAAKATVMRAIANEPKPAPCTFEEAHRLFEITSDGSLVRKVHAATTARAGDIVGTDNGNGHLQVKIRGRSVMVHHIVWFMTTGDWPQQTIDHINGIRSDNRPENLRVCSSAENCQNRTVRAGNRSGYMGVHLHKPGIWRASIMAEGKNVHLGCFTSTELAHDAYLKAKRELHQFNPAPRIAVKTCDCSAYKWPHRPGSGKCPAPEIATERYSTDPRPAWEAEERRLFDAAEARAINSGAW